MARERSKPSQDNGSPVPAWMTTFSDCMTLLLTFFVLLLSFSSFDVVKYSYLKGALQCKPEMTLSSIFTKQSTPQNSYVPDKDTVVDWTKEGAELPDTLQSKEIKAPKTHEQVLQIDAYSDKRTFYVPAKDMFLANGSVLSSHGRELLSRIGRFMKMLPCHMVAYHASPHGSGSAGKPAKDVSRAYAIIRYVIDTTGLPRERFRIAAHIDGVPGYYLTTDVVRIDLLNRDVTRQ